MHLSACARRSLGADSSHPERQLLGLLFVLLAAAFVISASVKIIGQAEVMVIERLGRFHRVARSGLNFIIPMVERAKKLDVRYFESDVSGVKRVTSSSTVRIDLRE